MASLYSSTPDLSQTQEQAQLAAIEDGMDGDNRFHIEQMMAHIMMGDLHTSEEQLEMEEELENDLFNISNKMHDRVFGWMPFNMKGGGWGGWALRRFMIVGLICLYITGLV